MTLLSLLSNRDGAPTGLKKKKKNQASLDEERIELANAAVGRWMPARVKNMSYSHYSNVMCRMMCSGAVCAYFKKLRRRLSPEDPAART